MIKFSGKSLLPRIYLHPINVAPTFNGKIKVSVRKTTVQYVNSRKWKSTWLILSPQKHSWFTTDRVYWKTFTKTKNSEAICK